MNLKSALLVVCCIFCIMFSVACFPICCFFSFKKTLLKTRASKTVGGGATPLGDLNNGPWSLGPSLETCEVEVVHPPELVPPRPEPTVGLAQSQICRTRHLASTRPAAAAAAAVVSAVARCCCCCLTHTPELVLGLPSRP